MYSIESRERSYPAPRFPISNEAIQKTIQELSHGTEMHREFSLRKVITSIERNNPLLSAYLDLSAASDENIEYTVKKGRRELSPTWMGAVFYRRALENHTQSTTPLPEIDETHIAQFLLTSGSEAYNVPYRIVRFTLDSLRQPVGSINRSEFSQELRDLYGNELPATSEFIAAQDVRMRNFLAEEEGFTANLDTILGLSNDPRSKMLIRNTLADMHALHKVQYGIDAFDIWKNKGSERKTKPYICPTKRRIGTPMSSLRYLRT